VDLVAQRPAQSLQRRRALHVPALDDQAPDLVVDVVRVHKMDFALD
jgi:hypothetical protein